MNGPVEGHKIVLKGKKTAVHRETNYRSQQGYLKVALLVQRFNKMSINQLERLFCGSNIGLFPEKLLRTAPLLVLRPLPFLVNSGKLQGHCGGKGNENLLCI
jgi:hypothetical protein